MKRREFVRDATGVAAWTALSASRVLGANDRVVVGLLGCGARGPAVMRGMLEAPGAELAAICDVYDTNAARANTTLVNGKAKTMKDFRRVLEMKEVDAIYVATPDFWHSIHTVMSLEAGKHVFVEKPFALTIREGRVMVEAAARTKKILMPATQHRSAPHIIEAASMVASGEIGQVAFVRAWNSRNVDGMWTKVPDSDPPRLRWRPDHRLRQSPNRQRVPDHGHEADAAHHLGGRTADLHGQRRRPVRPARGSVPVPELRAGVHGRLSECFRPRWRPNRYEVLPDDRPV